MTLPKFHRTRALTLVMFVLSVWLVGCGAAAPAFESQEAPAAAPARESKAADSGFADDAAAAEEGTALNTAGDVVARRIIIYQGDMEMVVADVPAAVEQIIDLAARQGGYVSSSSINRSEYNLYGEITIRIDAQRYQDTLSKLRELGIGVLSENTNSQDVTEEFVDLQARKTNLEFTEQALQQILEKQQAGNKIDDVLQVYRELTTVRGEIEQIEGRLRYLQNQAALATITVTLYPEEDPVPEIVDIWQPLKVAGDAWDTLLDILRNLADAGIWLTICGLPLLVLGAILLFIGRWGYRRWRKNNPPKPKPAKSAPKKTAKDTAPQKPSGGNGQAKG